MMDCYETKDRLAEKRQTASVRRHVVECEDCASFEREIRTGGRAIAEAYLASPPAPGFEERVFGRLREKEITVRRPWHAGRFALILAPAAALLLVVIAWQVLAPTNAPVPEPEPIAPTATVVPTEPVRENPLFIRLDRLTSDDRTELLLSFAGVTRQVSIAGEVESEVLTAWALGARTAEVTVGVDVPGRDIVKLIALLEASGFAYSIVRPK